MIKNYFSLSALITTYQLFFLNKIDPTRTNFSKNTPLLFIKL